MKLSNKPIIESTMNGSLSCLNNENRLITTPWSRLVRGLGLGQYPITFNEKVSRWILDTFDELKNKTGSKNNYTLFSSLLCELIYLLVNPKLKLSEQNMKNYIFHILALIEIESNPYRQVMQYSVIIDSLAKLNVNLFSLLKGSIDLPELLLKSIHEIKSDHIKDENIGKHGCYEKLSAYTSMFFALAACEKSHIAIDRNLISDALNTLGEIPSPFFRGRGGSMLFSAISLMGHTKELFANDRNYITEMLDYLDSADTIDINPSFPQPVTSHFVKIYPLLTLLNAIAATGYHQALRYQRDRIHQATVLLEALTPIERTHMGLYYIMAIYNLGLIEEKGKYINTLVEELVQTSNTINLSENYFLNGIACSYVIETAMISGRRHTITDQLLTSLANSFSTMDKSFEDEINRPYPFSYAFTMLGEIGCIDKLFTPTACYDNKSATSWLISKLTQFSDDTDGRLYMFNHALINLMLRMRGSTFPELKAYCNFIFR